MEYVLYASSTLIPLGFNLFNFYNSLIFIIPTLKQKNRKLKEINWPAQASPDSQCANPGVVKPRACLGKKTH